MASTNTRTKTAAPLTHEGAVAKKLTKVEELRRSVMATMLFEDQYYEGGVSIAERIATLAKEVPLDVATGIAIEARTVGNLRHAPLWILASLHEKKLEKLGDRILLGQAVRDVIQRPDEMGELISMYWKNGKKPLPKQMQKGLAAAFKKFNAYQLAKYAGTKSKAITPRDVMFLTHPTPDNDDQRELFKLVANRQLPTPDTWETQLSAGGDKREVFMQLMDAGKLGALAFLRNLRNMEQAGVPMAVVKGYAQRVKTDKVLPFRFLSAAKAVPAWSHMIEDMMLRALSELEPWSGHTVILVDNSDSMYGTKISTKSDLERIDAACALAILVRGVCEHATVIPFSNHPTVLESHYKGLALKDAIRRTEVSGTDIGCAVAQANKRGYDRIILITDEQSATRLPAPLVPPHKAFCINVASYQNGLGYRQWTHIDGFSESIVSFMREYERYEESHLDT